VSKKACADGREAQLAPPSRDEISGDQVVARQKLGLTVPPFRAQINPCASKFTTRIYFWLLNGPPEFQKAAASRD